MITRPFLWVTSQLEPPIVVCSWMCRGLPIQFHHVYIYLSNLLCSSFTGLAGQKCSNWSYIYTRYNSYMIRYLHSSAIPVHFNIKIGGQNFIHASCQFHSNNRQILINFNQIRCTMCTQHKEIKKSLLLDFNLKLYNQPPHPFLGWERGVMF